MRCYSIDGSRCENTSEYRIKRLVSGSGEREAFLCALHAKPFQRFPKEYSVEKIDWLVVGEKYNWIGQPERLIYLGYNFSSNGNWHQFAKVDSPDVVWCECLTEDLKNIEKTKS